MCTVASGPSASRSMVNGAWRSLLRTWILRTRLVITSQTMLTQ
nr:uncharacterized protein CTRU02_02577 [Colletotrichum truncatum]KAF6798603.1 hypothetical protein CTRU02_02577 [Colletotrichum truncatum]